MRRIDPIRLARLYALGVLAGALSSLLLLVPRLVDLDDAQGPWLLTQLLLGGLTALLWWARVLRSLRPLRGPDRRASRRAANEFPFLLTRAILRNAVSASLTTLLTLSLIAGQHSALVPAILTYLILILPAPWAYLMSRRLLRRWAAGRPEEGPPAGLRQPLSLRLGFALSLPIIACSVGIVLIDRSNNARYHAEIFADAQRSDALILTQMRQLAAEEAPHTAEEASHTAEEAPPSALSLAQLGLQRSPPPQPLAPLALIGLMGLLAALLAHHLSRHVQGDLTALRGTLEPLSQGDLDRGLFDSTLPLRLRFHESMQIYAATHAAVQAFQEQAQALQEATHRGQAAQLEKQRFLAQLSHELKSPLNTILGFAEVLLEEIEGPISPSQRRVLLIQWRAGERLLRFILALLDLARLEVLLEPTAPVQLHSTGLRPQHCTSDALVAALHEQIRLDPDQAIRCTIEAPTEAVALHIDLQHTSRALMLLLGSLSDLLDEGALLLRLTVRDQTLQLAGRIAQGEPDRATAQRLRVQVTAPEADETPPPGASEGPCAPQYGSGAFGTAWQLAAWIFTQQGGALHNDGLYFQATLPLAGGALS